MRSKNKKPAGRGSRGFTSLELIIVIIILGILAATIVIKNPFSMGDYGLIAADQLIADIQYVQMRAMGIGQSQRISLVNNSSSYNIRDKDGNILETKNLAKEIKFISNNFSGYLSFNSLGEPYYDTGMNCPTTDEGCMILLEGNVTIMIYQITGKACKYDVDNKKCL